MKKLLGDKFSTFTQLWGFLEAPYEDLAEDLVASRLLFTGIQMDRQSVQGGLEQLFTELDDPPNLNPRFLFTETCSSWTALFSNHSGAPSGRIAYLAGTLPCRALTVACVEHTYNLKTKTGACGGGVHFTLRGSDGQSMPIRDIGVTFDDLRNKWKFRQYGEPLPFEHVDRYSATNIPDRFTCEMLEEYCLALGIRLYDRDFYGPRGILLY